MKGFHDVDVKCRGRFEMNAVFQHFFHHKREMRAFGTVAIMIIAFVIDLSHRYIEHAPCFLDIFGNLGQVSNAKRGAVLFNNIHKWNAEPAQFVFIHSEFLIGKFKGLFN